MVPSTILKNWAKPRFVGISLLSLLISALSGIVIGNATAAGDTQLQDEEIKILYRRQPRCQALLPKIEKLISGSSNGNEALSRRAEFLQDTLMSAGSLAEDRLQDAVDLLSKLTAPVVTLEASDLRQLQERYQKLCSLIDDQILAKDLETALNQHDRFIQLTSMGALDKDQIASQLQEMEQSIVQAPAIPYGRTELLRSLEGKKLLAPRLGCYVGVISQEELFLGSNRHTVAILEEATGAAVQLDAAQLVIQGQDGRQYDLNSANHPDHHLPFAPPLSCWLKSRLLEGHVPAVQFCLSQKQFIDPKHDLCVQDILEGKLDDYFAKNLKLLAATRAPVLVGLFAEFDRQTVATALGADGRTPYYLLVDPKLVKLSPDKLQEDLPQRLSKGALSKDSGAELRKYYGDPSIPDGPERVAAAWNHLAKIVADSDAHYISLYAASGAFHGNKKALAFPDCAWAGAQEWNKLEYYWPGEGIISWIGSAGSGRDLSPAPYSLEGSIGSFMQELSTSNWRATTVFLSGLGPGSRLPAKQESSWISSCFQGLLPNNYPQIKAFYLSFPSQISLYAADSFSTFRRAVSSTSYFKQPLNLR